MVNGIEGDHIDPDTQIGGILGASPTRIDIGNGRAWAKSHRGGWAEMPSHFEIAMLDHNINDPRIRLLTPAEVDAPRSKVSHEAWYRQRTRRPPSRPGGALRSHARGSRRGRAKAVRRNPASDLDAADRHPRAGATHEGILSAAAEPRRLTPEQRDALNEIALLSRSVWLYGSTTINVLRKEGLVYVENGIVHITGAGRARREST